MTYLCITDAVKQFGVTSKTLRYYERVGLLDAKRVDGNNYRCYDEAEVERIKQILVLRKMQIPVKDIIRIYENKDMSVVVEVFVDRINAIDAEVEALTELKRITNDFLQTMRGSGITKISALPILYEQMEKQLTTLEAGKKGLPGNYAELSALSDKLRKPLEPSIISLPQMRVLSSKRKDGVSDQEGFFKWLKMKGLSTGKPGLHERFDFQEVDITSHGDVIDISIVRISEDYINDSDYSDYIFPGGLFAAVNVYLDEDVGAFFRTVIKEFDDNKYYQIDYQSVPTERFSVPTGRFSAPTERFSDGSLRHAAMLENLISPDAQRELVALLVPVKKRLADPKLFDPPEEVTEISLAEIEAANPVLWEINVALDKMTPINNPHYQMMENGEVEYIGWISTRLLNTNVAVKLPYRVDIEFRLPGVDGMFGHGDSEGSIIFYHGEDLSQLFGSGTGSTEGFGINMGNQPGKLTQAIKFYQPIFHDLYNFPGRGAVKIGEYNHVTWIIGEKYLAVIINDEVRYCGSNFPYMVLDLSREETHPIIIGSNGQGKKYFRSIRISQLSENKKINLKKGELTMITKQSNNMIPIIHRLVTDEYGENYWFNGCAKYVMECLGEKDYDYWFFAGITGDLFTQHYSYKNHPDESLSSYLLEEKPVEYTEEVFAKCGYSATFVPKKDLRKNTEMYLNTLIAYIDKGIPVIVWGTPIVGVYVGYEEHGKTLLYITGNNNQPLRISLDDAMEGRADNDGWIFVGDKKVSRPLAELYSEAIFSIPIYNGIKTENYVFGAEAFRLWADDIEKGKFDNIKIEDFDLWHHHTNYICVLATNGSCSHGFLDKARELNADMDFLTEVSRLYRRWAQMWGGDSTKNDEDNLEALGAGFNVTLEVLQDKEKRVKVARKSANLPR